MAGVNNPYRYKYQTVAASQTGTVLIGKAGGGAVGDYLHRIVLTVNTAATASLTILDGATSISLQTGAATVIPGVYSIELNMVSASGAWSVTTGAGCTIVAVGIFT